MIQNSDHSKSFKAVGGELLIQETGHWLDSDQWNAAGRVCGSWAEEDRDLCECPCIDVRHCDYLDREDQSSMRFIHQIMLRLAFRTRKQLQQIKLVQSHYKMRGCRAMRGQHIFKHHHHDHPPVSVNVLKRLKRCKNHEPEQRADTWGCSRPVCARCLGTCCFLRPS